MTSSETSNLYAAFLDIGLRDSIFTDVKDFKKFAEAGPESEEIVAELVTRLFKSGKIKTPDEGIALSKLFLSTKKQAS